MSVRLGLLNRYIIQHNHGVRTGNFEILLKLFDENTEIIFENIDNPPLTGIEQITKSFTENPPKDELVLMSVLEMLNFAEASYAWKSNPRFSEGTIKLFDENNLITKLVIKKY